MDHEFLAIQILKCFRSHSPGNQKRPRLVSVKVDHCFNGAALLTTVFKERVTFGSLDFPVKSGFCRALFPV